MASAMTKVSMSKYNQLAKRLQSVQQRANKIKEATGEKLEYLVRSSEIGVTGFALGALRGAKGRTEIGGVPVEVVVAGIAHTAALFGIGGKMNNHLHAFGDGALAVAAMDLGELVGQKGFSGLKQSFLPSSTPSSKGQRLTDAELDELTKG